ncbi:MAG: hypothetical protein WDN50_11515 [Bradyrhizobium sp.]
MQALRSWGALDRNYAYKANLISAEARGYAKDPGGGLTAVPPLQRADRAIGYSSNRGSGVICRISRATISRPRCFSRSAAWT